MTWERVLHWQRLRLSPLSERDKSAPGGSPVLGFNIDLPQHLPWGCKHCKPLLPADGEAHRHPGKRAGWPELVSAPSLKTPRGQD